MKKITIFFTIIISIMSSQSFAKDFNFAKLNLICDFISKDSNSCKKDVLYLIDKNKNNSIINYCSTKYNTIKSFNNCLKYEYNPLVFFKYKDETVKVPEFKKMGLTNEIKFKCRKGDKDEIMSCYKENYLLLKKASTKINWIETYCTHENNKLARIKNCVDQIKKESLRENDLMKNIPALNDGFETLNNKFKNKSTFFFNQIYKACNSLYNETSSYNNTNIYACIEGELDPIVESFTNYKMTDILCLGENNFEIFKECVIKSK